MGAKLKQCPICPHRAHLGLCTARSGGTAHACMCMKTTLALGPATHNPLVDIEVHLAELLAENAQWYATGVFATRDERAVADEASIEHALIVIEQNIAAARRPRGPMEAMVDKATGYDAVRAFWLNL